jgi:hypothetical protein
LTLQENLNLIRNGDIHRKAMLGEEDSLGQEAAEKVVEDLKFELALLNAALKKLDADWDFTVLINPLLADRGPANRLRLPSFRSLRGRLIG